MVELNIVNFVTIAFIAIIAIALVRFGAGAVGKKSPV